MRRWCCLFFSTTQKLRTSTLKGSDEERLRDVNIESTLRYKSVRNKWRNEEVKALLGIECDVVAVIRKRRLTYFGHTVRMKSERILANVIQSRIHVSRET